MRLSKKSDRWSWVPGRSKSGKDKSTKSSRAGQSDYTTDLNFSPKPSFKSKSRNGSYRSLLARCEANQKTVSEALYETYDEQFSKEYDDWASERPKFANNDGHHHMLACKSQRVASWMLADAMRRTTEPSDDDKSFKDMMHVMNRVDAELREASERGELTSRRYLEDRVCETEGILDEFEGVVSGEMPVSGVGTGRRTRSGYSRRSDAGSETERPTALAIVGTAAVFAGISYLAYKRWTKK